MMKVMREVLRRSEALMRSRLVFLLQPRRAGNLLKQIDRMLCFRWMNPTVWPFINSQRHLVLCCLHPSRSFWILDLPPPQTIHAFILIPGFSIEILIPTPISHPPQRSAHPHAPLILGQLPPNKFPNTTNYFLPVISQLSIHVLKLQQILLPALQLLSLATLTSSEQILATRPNPVVKVIGHLVPLVPVLQQSQILGTSLLHQRLIRMAVISLISGRSAHGLMVSPSLEPLMACLTTVKTTGTTLLLSLKFMILMVLSPSPLFISMLMQLFLRYCSVQWPCCEWSVSPSPLPDLSW
jgi:hypothetical protein